MEAAVEEARLVERQKMQFAVVKAKKDMAAGALTYTGQVTDKLTGKPIAGATVTVRAEIAEPYSIGSSRSRNVRPTRPEDIRLPFRQSRSPCLSCT